MNYSNQTRSFANRALDMMCYFDAPPPRAQSSTRFCLPQMTGSQWRRHDSQLLDHSTRLRDVSTRHHLRRTTLGHVKVFLSSMSAAAPAKRSWQWSNVILGHCPNVYVDFSAPAAVVCFAADSLARRSRSSSETSST